MQELAYDEYRRKMDYRLDQLDSKEEGFEQGKQEGIEQGRKEGKQEGIEQGRKKGTGFKINGVRYRYFYNYKSNRSFKK
ncbi:MAG: hypothetical protein GDA46_01480 [Bdellovibrionales bacterium]|nr:hypothetical protein [Bdellovibrionales bacterium]